MPDNSQLFVFESNSSVRIVERDGAPWFVAADICRAIGIAQAGRAIEPLDNDEKGVISTHTLGGTQEVNIISESGLYALILRSRNATKPGTVAHRFRKWITSEVLPSVRRTGAYQIASQTPLQTFEEIAQQARAQLAQEVAEISRSIQAKEALVIQTNGEILQMKANRGAVQGYMKRIEALISEGRAVPLLG